MRHGSTKCSCRSSTYSITRSVRSPLTRDVVDQRQVLDVLARARRRRRAGTPGTPKRAASSSTASTSLTPPSRQASSWQTSIAPAWRSCLNTMRFWQCSPVATRTGATAAGDPGVAEDVVGAGRLLDPPRVELGERAPCGRSPPRRPTPGWRPSSGGGRGRSPRGSARRGGRRPPRLPPTFIFTCVQPASTAARGAAADLVVGEAEPARRGGVGGEAVAAHLGLALRPAGRALLEQGDGLRPA